MTISTIALLILSIIIAASLSFFHYLYKAKSQSKLYWLLAFLRFVAIFGVLLLLINPIINRNTLEISKTPLAVVIDNSNSISFLKATTQAKEVYKELLSNSGLNEKFEIQPFLIDGKFYSSDSLKFKGTKSQLDIVGKELRQLYKNKNFPTIFITDGNQTEGNDYVYSFNTENKVFPIVLGDTTTVFDLKINQINVNKYAFYKNKFPVEVFVQYTGIKSSEAFFSTSEGKNIIHKQPIKFTNSQKTTTFSVLLPADKIGLHLYKVTINSGTKERNTFNNTTNFAVEVLDQKTKIGIVSAISHPDLSALKRSIESNAQREVTLLKPQDYKLVQDYNVLIFYQPNSAFKSVYDFTQSAGINTFVITGMSTDFNFLNKNQKDLNFNINNQKEDFTPLYHSQFNLFASENIGFENFPPLTHPFGKITPSSNVIPLLTSKIRNISTGYPLLAFAEDKGKRKAYLLGEDSWKWRMQSYVNDESFDKYDIFIAKTIQFLASNSTKKVLTVTHENFYNSGEAISITAQFFNKNYEFDENARLSITVKNSNTKQTKNYDLLKKSNTYQVNLDGLAAGSYTFVVKELNTNNSYSGRFEILEFDVEKQFVTPDYGKLSQLAEQTKGAAFMPNQVKILIEQLLKDESYKAIEKEKNTKSPLIDWKWLLLLITLFLSTEWFIRKYNGLL